MRQWIWVAALTALSACKGKGGDGGSGTGSDDNAGPVPGDCLAGVDVCVSYSSAWTEEDAAAHCDDLDGDREDCPDGALGQCTFSDGLTYSLYDMSPVDAKGYCDWLKGSWALSE